MEFLKQYEILYKKAKTDLKAAKNLLEDFENGDEDLDLETILFHLQQCSEKLFKTILSFNQKHFTKTHDLETLYDVIVESNIFLENDIKELLPLSEYAVEGRYAIIHDDIEDTHNYINILDEFKIFVEKMIKAENI